MMDIYDLIKLCKKFDKLGWAVQAQLSKVIDGESLESLNPNALRMIADFLRSAERAGVEGAKEMADEIEGERGG